MEKQRYVLLFIIVAAFVAASWWSTSGFLRKNDQAVILAGAHDWARGDRQPWSQYYQFDKTYVLYVYCAGVLKINRLTGASIDPILLANRAVASAFWLALFVFVIRYRRTLSPLVLFAALAAPAILLNTQYVNSSTLSSAFLLLAVAALPKAVSASGAPTSGISVGAALARTALPACLLFLAVGARADIVLLLPLLCWLAASRSSALHDGGRTSPREGRVTRARVFQRLENDPSTSSNGWKNPPTFFQRLENRLGIASNDWKTPTALLVAAWGALLVGRIWSDGVGATLVFFFNFNMVLGYWVFGFGAASLLFLWVPFAWWRQKRSWWSALGVGAFLIPLLFFLPQLHAPRYFWRACEALLIVSALAPFSVPRLVRRAVWLAAALPLVVGMALPTLNQVRITVHDPTLFPSGDGHYPMGAYVSFLRRFREADDRPIDHNQRVWTAVRSADVGNEEPVTVLFTPMFGYFLLDASLRETSAQWASYAAVKDRPFFVDSRSLMRDDVKFPFAARAAILQQPVEVVSRDVDGIAVLRVGSGDQAWGRQTQLLNRLFAGNEYRIVSSGRDLPPNRKTVWFSETPFPGASRDPETGWHYAQTPHDAAAVRIAYSALPAWMSVQAFAGE